MGDKLHRREGNNPDRLLRSLNCAQCERKLEYCDSRDVGLEAAIISKVRNSLLVEESCADNERDLSVMPKQRVLSSVEWPVPRERSISSVTFLYQQSDDKTMNGWPLKGG